MGRGEYEKLRPENWTLHRDKKHAKKKTVTEKEFKLTQSSPPPTCESVAKFKEPKSTGTFSSKSADLNVNSSF